MKRASNLRAVKPERIYTASELTKSAITRLKIEFGADVWRQNQIPAPGRAFIGRKGVGDITGYTQRQIIFKEKVIQPGTRVECEVKAWGDVLSEDQVNFLSEATKAGCLCLVCFQDGYKAELIFFTDYVERFKK